MQSFVAVGRLTRTPELTYGQQAKCTFVIAVETRVGKFKKTDYFPCVAWRELAELIAHYTVKGQRVGIEGKWRSHTFEKNGERQARFEIEVYDCNFYDSPAQN